jgi:hypothetical protein
LGQDGIAGFGLPVEGGGSCHATFSIDLPRQGNQQSAIKTKSPFACQSRAAGRAKNLRLLPQPRREKGSEVLWAAEAVKHNPGACHKAEAFRKAAKSFCRDATFGTNSQSNGWVAKRERRGGPSLSNEQDEGQAASFGSRRKGNTKLLGCKLFKGRGKTRI